MTERISSLCQFFITEKKHRAFRRASFDAAEFSARFQRKELSPFDRAVLRLQLLLDEETPLFFPNQRILFLRTLPSVPELFTAEETGALRQKYHLHERGEISNICVDYETFLALGLPGMVHRVEDCRSRLPEKSAFYDGELAVLHALNRLVRRYRDKALRQGNPAAETLSALLERAPVHFQEALQLMRILHFTMWLAGNYHNTLGRIDCYLAPYLEQDLKVGILTETDAFELLEEFFLTFNLDSDLYPGMQQGNNRQSIVLGGCLADGTPLFKRLSK